MAGVNITFTGDSADAQAAIAKLERKYAELENKIGQVAKKTKDSGGESIQAMGRVTQLVLGVSSAWDIVGKSIDAAKASYQSYVEEQDKKKDVNVNFGKAVTGLYQNVGANDDPQEVKQRLLKLSEESEMSPTDISKILNAAQASKGDLKDEDVDKTIRSAARVSRLDPEAMTEVVGTSLDVQKQIKGTTAEQAIGSMMNFGAESHIRDQSQYARTVVPAAVGMSKMDSSGFEFQLALGNAITHALGDTKGKTTATSMIALEMQLAKAMPEQANTAERIKAVQANPELRDAMLYGGEYTDKKTGKKKKLHLDEFEAEGPDGQSLKLGGDKFSFEKRAVPGIHQILTAGSFAANEVTRNLQTVPSMAQSGESFERRAEGMAADPNIRVAEMDNRLKVTAEQDRLKDTKSATDSVSRTGLDDAMKAKDFTWMQRQGIEWDSYFRSSGTGKARAETDLDVLREQRDGYRRGAEDPKATDSEVESRTDMVNKLQELIDVLTANGRREEKDAVAGGLEMPRSPRADRSVNRNGNVE